MPVVNVPGFWDYLSQGYLRGEENARVEAERQDRLRQQEVQNNFAALKTAMEAGDQESVQRVSKLIPSLRGVNFNETPQQLQSRILKAPQGPGISAQVANTGMGAPLFIPKVAGQDSFTDDQRRVAGLPTTLQKKEERVKGKKLDLEEAQTASSLTNLPRDEQLKRQQQLMPVLKDAADRFISGPILKAGGNLNPKNLEGLAEQAFQNFIKESQNRGYGNFTPEDAQQAKAYFDGAVRDAYNAQLDRQIKRLAALPASAFGTREFNPATMVNALNGLAKAKQGQIDDMMKANPLLGTMLNVDPAQLPSQMQQQLQQLQMLTQQRGQLEQAAAGFGAGIIPVEMAQKLLMEFATGSSVGVAAPVPPAGSKAGLTPADKAQAKTNPRFAKWLKDRGYTEADWR